MSFVGTRPEATKYVEKYSKEMFATLSNIVNWLMDDMHKIPNRKDVISLKYTQICDIFMVKNGSSCEGGEYYIF